MKLQARPATLLKKETLAQVFSCEFCEIFKNTFFTEHLRTTASVSISELFENDLHLTMLQQYEHLCLRDFHVISLLLQNLEYFVDQAKIFLHIKINLNLT